MILFCLEGHSSMNCYLRYSRAQVQKGTAVYRYLYSRRGTDVHGRTKISTALDLVPVLVRTMILLCLEGHSSMNWYLLCIVGT